ncbi:hypothetical protein NNC19_13585 [Clostridium sp. SHJSY1]|uniref:hypothetical protein n=1 Tax=Clostridium sp. SHJSY1 TaxID=2942483 RepID=UPI002876459D|nr:hypothetical protein [Clostridium sp. SHJSY1]MDS0526718.1 hypothetical protein [Clostridium sp. SHJSY1]
MKINQKICFVLVIIFAIITMCLGILHLLNYFHGSIDIMMIFLGLTMFMSGVSQINRMNEKV